MLPEINIHNLVLWRSIQVSLFIIGVILIYTLVFMPNIGIHLFWNILIPITPAIIVIISGVWRNICPMASFGLLPRHLGISKREIISEKTRSHYILIGFIALLLILPLRHLSLNMSGEMTALMLISAAIISFLVGLKYEWKSVWCSGLCPISHVERLYGTNTAITVDNAHCTACEKCSVPCSDSTKAMTPLVTNNNNIENIVGLSMAGGFFGYILGWFNVPDYIMPVGFLDILYAFMLPFGGFFISLGLFLILYKKAVKQNKKILISLFATLAVSAYYWYRIPMLFGCGMFPNDGMLIDLTEILPQWFPMTSNIITTGFFFWFIMLRKSSKKSWLNRPQYSIKALEK